LQRRLVSADDADSIEGDNIATAMLADFSLWPDSLGAELALAVAANGQDEKKKDGEQR
jgi:hypothetical protein